MSQKAICLVTFKPNKIYLDFLNKFDTYDIYIIIDDNENNYNDIKIQYPKLNFVQIMNEECVQKLDL